MGHGIYPWHEAVRALPPQSTTTMRPRRFVLVPKLRRNAFGGLSLRFGRRVYLVWWARA